MKGNRHRQGPHAVESQGICGGGGGGKGSARKSALKVGNLLIGRQESRAANHSAVIHVISLRYPLWGSPAESSSTCHHKGAETSYTRAWNDTTLPQG